VRRVSRREVVLYEVLHVDVKRSPPESFETDTRNWLKSIHMSDRLQTLATLRVIGLRHAHPTNVLRIAYWAKPHVVHILGERTEPPGIVDEQPCRFLHQNA
jgi:hypothetical protein